MGVNIKDIARLSGVGISTVSRVLNQSGAVSGETVKKVMEIVDKYNYIPNSNARNLKKNNSKNIALLVKGITNPFFNKLIRGIEKEVALRGYPLLIKNVDSMSGELDIAIQEKADRNLCGVIIMGGSYGYSEAKFRQLGIPCVLVTISAGEDVDTSLYSSVRINDEQEAFHVMESLISLGHRRIGFIFRNPYEVSTPNALRYNGYINGLSRYDIPFDPELVAINTTEAESGLHVGFQLMKQLCARNRNMTAVFAFADILAIGAAKAALSMDLKIPDDMTVVGFDGIEMTEYFHPSLDTVYQPAVEMALSSTEILFDMINGGPSRHVVYDSIFLRRGSSKAIV